jgi:hypothetical protein
MAKKSLPMPEVDFSRVGRKWTRKFSDLVHEAQRYNTVLLNIAPEGSSLKAIEDYEETYQAYYAKLQDAGTRQYQAIADVLVAVPQECLTSDAPESSSIDWTDAEAFDWVRQDVMTEFITALQTGELAKQSAKN